MSPERNDAPVVGLLAAIGVAALAYSLIIVQQVLFGLLIVCLLAGVYVGWRFVRAFERIARSLAVIAEARRSELE